MGLIKWLEVRIFGNVMIRFDSDLFGGMWLDSKSIILVKTILDSESIFH